MDVYAFYIFIGIVIAVALTVGWWLGWDRDDGSKFRLDPDRITREMIDDPTLSANERTYMRELAALELPRRHLIC
jgi:hypothetical protein|tara:strand:+ start:540 stop:764 length:225 start_codon:yes stop_codon:yes gene_type:complete